MNNHHQTEGWDKGFIVTMATVKSVIDQYAQGTIQLELPQGKGRHNIRYAGADNNKPYTASTVGKFLRWIEADGTASFKVFDAVNALQVVEEGKVDISAFAGISESQAHKILVDLKRQELTSDDPNPPHNSMNPQEYRTVRENLRLTQQKLSETLGVDIRTIQRREVGDVPINDEARIALQHLIPQANDSVKTSNKKDTISLSVEDAKKIHHTLIGLAQSCLELAKLVDM